MNYLRQNASNYQNDIASQLKQIATVNEKSMNDERIEHYSNMYIESSGKEAVIYEFLQELVNFKGLNSDRQEAFTSLYWRMAKRENPLEKGVNFIDLHNHLLGIEDKKFYEFAHMFIDLSSIKK
ncbi:hypothetical protein [Maridesulfovibrio sp.]|uniref:hypothetical protein n=1 Tax=Maridesulfovibrio sp. TaxID=2795000 RepID=UPI003B0099A6